MMMIRSIVQSIMTVGQSFATMTMLRPIAQCIATMMQNGQNRYFEPVLLCIRIGVSKMKWMACSIHCELWAHTWSSRKVQTPRLTHASFGVRKVSYGKVINDNVILFDSKCQWVKKQFPTQNSPKMFLMKFGEQKRVKVGSFELQKVRNGFLDLGRTQKNLGRAQKIRPKPVFGPKNETLPKCSPWNLVNRTGSKQGLLSSRKCATGSLHLGRAQKIQGGPRIRPKPGF